MAFARVAAAFGFTAVAAGAYGAHGLSTVDEHWQEAWGSAVQYHLAHSIVILGLAHTGATSTRTGKVAASLFTLGVLGFSGSIYVRVLALEQHPEWSSAMARVTPKGGMALLLAWAAVGFVRPPAVVAARSALQRATTRGAASQV